MIRILYLMILIVATAPFNLAADEVVHLTQEQYFERSKDENTVLIDIRTEHEFERGYILGARHLPLSRLLSDPGLLHELRGKDLVFYCHTGVRVKRLTDFLEAQGESENYGIYHLKGDYRAWSARQFPVER